MAEYDVIIRLRDIEEGSNASTPERAVISVLSKMPDDILHHIASVTVEWGWQGDSRVMSKTFNVGSAVVLKSTIEPRRS